MNKTLVDILKSREDISDYLLHFTNGANALATLRQIVLDHSLKDIHGKGRICFSEAPLTLLPSMFNIFDRYPNPMYAPYGIAIRKDALFNKGARPVIYGTTNDLSLLPIELKWRFEEYRPNARDFTWLREWRLPHRVLELKKEDCFIITKWSEELTKLLFTDEDLIDVEFDGCVADGQFHGDTYGTFERSFKGVSIEELTEVNSLSKQALYNIINAQKFDDRIEIVLGGFTM